MLSCLVQLLLPSGGGGGNGRRDAVLGPGALLGPEETDRDRLRTAAPALVGVLWVGGGVVRWTLGVVWAGSHRTALIAVAEVSRGAVPGWSLDRAGVVGLWLVLVLWGVGVGGGDGSVPPVV